MSCGSVDTFVLDEASFNLSRRDPSEKIRGMGENAELLQTESALSLVLVFNIEQGWL